MIEWLLDKRSSLILWVSFALSGYVVAQPTLDVPNTYISGRMKSGFILTLNYTAIVGDISTIDWYQTTGATTTPFVTHMAGLPVGTTATSGPLTATKIATGTNVTAKTFTLSPVHSGFYIYCVITPRNGTGTAAPVTIVPWIFSNPSTDHSLATDIVRYRVIGPTSAAAACLAGGNIGFINEGQTTACSGVPLAIQEIGAQDIGFNAAQGPFLLMDWGDGTTEEIQADLLNPRETAQFFQKYGKFNLSHTYNANTAPTPVVAGRLCSYVRKLTAINLRCTNTTFCGSPVPSNLLLASCTQSVSSQVSIWDTEDNTRIGTFDISKTSGIGVEPGGQALVLEVCEKETGNFALRDDSDFNCTPPSETSTKQNDRSRWVQWVYGTTGSTVPGVTVNGTTYTAAQFPIYGPVEYLPFSVINPNSATPNMSLPLTITAGQTFKVTLRSWNACNPYDDFEVDGGLNEAPDASPGAFDVKTTTPLLPTVTLANSGNGDNNFRSIVYNVNVITKPLPPTPNNKEFCAGTVLDPPAAACGSVTAANRVLSFELLTAPGSTLIEWFFGDPRLGGVALNANANVYTGGTNCLLFRPRGLLTTGAQGTMRTAILAGTPGVYSLWARYSTANGCTSDPIEVIMTIRPSLTVPAAPTGIANICNGGSSTYTLAGLPASTTIAANNITNSAPVNFATEYLWSGSNADVTFGTNPNTTATNNVTFNIATQPNPSTTRTLGAALQYQTADANGSKCTTTPVNNITVTVFGVTVGGSVTANQTICDGSAFATLNLAGQRGNVLRWERTFNAGAPSIIAATANLTSFSQTPPNGAGIYTYYAVVQNANGGPCSIVNSAAATITVNAVPPQPSISQTGASTGLTICADGVQQTVLQSSNVGAIAASYQWYKNGVAVGGATSSTITLTTVAQSGNYTVQTIGSAPSSCPSPISNPITVTINPLPTASNPTGGGAVCSGNPAPDIVWNLTGSPGFNVTYKITKNPGAIVSTIGPIVEPTNTFTISSPNPVGIAGDTFDYQIIALTDANGCVGSSFGTSRQVSIGGTAPTFDTPLSLTPAITCDAGAATTDPSLNFSLTPASTGAGNYTLTYKVNGGSNQTKTFTVNLGNGDPFTAITFSEVALNSVATHTIRVVSILTPTGCISTPNTDLSFTVRALPAITTQPANATICNLTNTTFSVVATGTDLSYQWQEKVGAGAFANIVNGGVYSGATTAALALTGATLAMSTNQYRVIVTAYNPPSSTPTCPVTSNTVTLTVNAFATITTQPTNAAQCVGLNTSFTIASSGPGITRQWQISTDGGATFTDLANVAPYSNVTTATLNITSVTAGLNNNQYRVRLTTTGSCSLNSTAGILTVNPLPAALNPAPAFCEAVAGGGSITGKMLTDHNDGVTGIVGSTDRTIAYFSDAGRTTNVTATAQTITNGKTYFTRVTTVSTGCVTDGTIVFTINSLPTAVNQNLSFCEDVQGTNTFGPFDLTSNNTTIAGGSLVSRSVSWFSNAGLTIAVPTPATYTLTGTTTLFARVTNTVTSCTNVATVTLTTKPRPVVNAIQGNASVCTGSTVILYQLDPSLNPGSNYSWTVTGTPAAAVQVFGGGGTNSANFFVLLKFPSATGTAKIDVFETLNGCTGVTNTLTVNINSAPAANTINGVAQVCTNATTVNYQVATPNATSTYTWSVTGATIASAAGPSINVDFSTISPVTIQVSETSASGCVGTAATKNVVVNPRPVMTSSSTSTACSGLAPSLVFTSTIASTYNWVIPPGGITGSITGATVGQSGTGDLSLTFTGVTALKNTSGAVGSVTFNVTPTATATGCVGTQQSIVITVNPEPSLVSAQTKTICSGQSVSYEILTSPLNLPSGTTFSWPAPVMSNGSSQGTPGTNVSAGVAGTTHLLDVLSNTSSAPITATYTITPTSGAGCLGVAKNVVITINPEPILSSSLDNTICSDISLGVTLSVAAGSVAANNYNITAKSVSSGLTPAGSNVAVPASGVASTYLSNDRYKNLTNVPLTVTYTIVPVSAAGCAGASKVVTFTINPEPALSASLDATVCSDAVAGINFSTLGTSIAASSYNVVGKTIASGLTSAGANAIVPVNGVSTNYIANDSYTNTTNASLTVVYQVVPVSSLGCLGDPPKSITLTILPEPVISAGLNASVCSRAVTGLTLSTTATSIAAAGYSITARTIDAGLVASASNAAVPASNQTSTYLASDVFTNTTNSALTVSYTVVPKSAGGCDGDAKVITITVNPEPVMSTTLDKTVCSDLATGLTLNTNGSSVGAASYNITARSISGGLTPNVANAAVPATGVAANYLASDVFTNVGSLPLAVTYTVVPVSSAGCLGVAKVITLTINPEPVVSGSLNTSVCSSVPIGVVLNTNGASVAANSYNITAISVAGGLTPGGGNAVVPNNAVSANYIANDVFVNSGGAALTVSYTIVPVSAAGCLGDVRVITMTVNPEPIMSSSLNATVCSNLVTGLNLNTNGTSVGAASFNVTTITVAPGLIASGSNATVATAVSSNYLANDKFTNTTGTALTVDYSVVAVSASGCPGPAKVITITINPEPVVSSALDLTVCSDLATGLLLATDGGSVAAANYNITSRTIAAGLTPGVGNVSVPSSNVAANYLIADVFTNSTTLPLNVTYVVVPVSASGCIGSPRTITIIIQPEPVVLSTLDLQKCSNLAIGLNLGTTATSVAAANYNITAQVIGTGLTAAGTNQTVPAIGVAANYLATDKFTNTTAASHTVTYTVVPVSAAGCQGDAKIITVTINPEPVVSTLLNSTVCSDAVINLTLNTNGTSVAAANYNITGKSADGGLIGAGTNAAIPATGVTATYLLNDKYNNIGTLPLNASYTVVPVSAGGCLGSPQVITITINPEPVLSSTLNLQQCSDLATGLVLNTSASSVAAQNYNITLTSVAAGLTAAVGNAVLPATGVNANYLGNDKFTNLTAGNLNVVYSIVPVSASGCLGDPVSVTITIQPEPVISTTLDASVCSQASVGLMLNTNGTSVAANTYNIISRVVAAGLVANVANVAVPASGVSAAYLATDKFTNTGNNPLTVTYTILGISAAGCLGDQKAITITINPEPVVSTLLNKTECSDVATGLTLATNGTSVAAATYNVKARSIAIGLTPAGANVAVPATGVAASYLSGDKFTNTGALPLTVTYTVEGVSGASCVGASQIITITINPEPVLSGSLNKTECSDIAIGLALNTNGTSVVAASYNILSVTIAGGLTAAGSNVAIPATGVAAGYLAGDKFTNTGASGLTVVYRVVPVSADGCLGDPVNVTVTIAPEPVVSSSLNTTVCSNLVTGLTLTTNGLSVAAANYNITAISIAAGLTADAGNVAVPASNVSTGYLANHKFVNTTNGSLSVAYTIVPVSAGGCLGDPKVVIVTIDPQPVVSNGLDAAVCSDASTSLTLNTNGVSIAAANYNILSRTVDGGLVPAGSNVTVPASGVAANYLAGDKFTNTGNSALSVVYTVVPVSGGLGCLGDSKVITITINPEPVVISGLDAPVCSDASIGLTLNTNGTSVAAATYNIVSRTVAGGLISNGSNATVPSTGVAVAYLSGDKFTNTTAGSLTVSYVVVPVSATGCLGDPKTITMTINPEPVLATNLNNSICSGTATGLVLTTNGSSVAAVSYNITAINVAGGLVADGGNVPAANGVAANYLSTDKFVNTGALPLAVTYTIVPVGPLGCLGDAQIVTITIDPQPVVSTGLDSSVCSGNSIGLNLATNGTSVGAATYSIVSRIVAPGLTASVSNASVPFMDVAANYLATDKYTNTGNTSPTVTYTVTPKSAAGCEGAAQLITITIKPEPVLSSTLNKTICSDEAGGITLNTNGSSIAATTYNVTAVTVPAGLTTVSAAAIPAVGVPSNYLATDRYMNTGSAALEVLYTVVPVSGDGCLGAPLVVKQIVRPEPVVGSLDKTVCSDIAVSLTLNTNGLSVAATTYNITAISIAAGLVPAVTNAAIPTPGPGGVTSSYLFNDMFTNPGNTPLTVSYTVVPISGNGCLGDAKIVTVTISPEPVVSTLLNRTVCSGLAGGIVLNTNGTSTPAVSYNVTNIQLDGGLTAVSGNVAIANGVAANYLANDKFTNTTNASLTVNYTIIPVSSDGCLGDPFVVVLTVDSQPVMDPSLASKVICSRATTGITLNTNGSSIAASTYDIVLISKDADLTGTPTTGTGLASNAILNDNYINVSSITQKVVYQITPRSAAGCYGAAFNITVTVNPEPVISPTLDNTVCSDESGNIILATNGISAAAASYELVSIVIPGSVTANVSNVAVSSTGGINLIRSDKFTNTSSSSAIVVYGIRGTSNATCVGQIQLINLTINPKPVLDPALNPVPVCSGITSGVTLGVAAGSVGAVSYNINSITFPNLTAGASNAGIGSGKAANAIFADTYINTTSGPQLATYKIVPVSAAGCLGAEGTVTLTINPSPALLDNLAETICSSDVSGLTLGTKGTSVAAANYNIISVTIQGGLTQTDGNTGARSGVAANEVSIDKFTNATNGTLTVTYKVEPVSAAGCKGPQVDVVLTIEPAITMIVPPNATICSDTPNTPSATNILLNSNTVPSSGVITFDYTAVSNPVGAVTGFFPAQNGLPRLTVIADKLVNGTNAVATVTYTITPNAANAKSGVGCVGATPTIVVITVEPKPRLSISPATQVVCEGVATTMTLSSATVPSAGTIQFTKMSAVQTGGMTLTTASKTTYLNGDPIGDVWDNPTTVAQTVTYTFRAEIVGGSGCISEDIVAVLTVNPSPTITASVQPAICSSDFVNITLTPDVANTIATYTASAPSVITGAANGAGNLIFQTLFYNSATPTVANSDGPVIVNYTVTPKANGCSGTPIIVPVTVHPKPKILNVPTTVKVCHGNSLVIPLTSNVTGANYTWTVDNPSNLTGIVEQTTPGNSGINQVLTNSSGVQASLTYTIKAFGPGVNPNDCEGDQKIVIVTIAPEMSASFQNAPSSICKGTSEFLIIELNGQAPFNFVYNVDNGSTSTDVPVTGAGNFKVIQVNPTTTTTYTLKSITDAFGCPFTIVGQAVTITVGDTDPVFSVIGATKACSPHQFEFQYNQKAGTQYTWQWQDGSADSTYLATTDVANQIVKHTFTNVNPNKDQDYNVTLRVELPAPFPGCFKFSSKKVTINSIIVTNIVPDKTDICSGETIRLTNQSLGVTSHRWFWRNTGTSAVNEVKTTASTTYALTNTGALNPQPIEIVYQANNGNCPAPDVIVAVNVYKGVTANFTFTPSAPIFNSGSSTLTFTNTSTPFDITQFRYDWVFGITGDASTPTLTQTTTGNIPVIYSSPGSKDITLSITNIQAEALGLGCKADITKSVVIVLPPLAASFDVDPKEFCFPGTIKLKNVVGTGFIHEWRVINKKTGVAFTSNVADPGEFKITTPGDYTISYKTSIPATAQVANAPLVDVKIYDLPLASFDLRPDVVFVPDTEMQLFNFSSGATGYRWNFGDSPDENTTFEPTYKYPIEGKYDVTLIAENDHGGGVVCRDTLVRPIIAKQGGQAKIPNAFTPNPNGPSSNGQGGSGTFNDVFLPIVRGVPNDSDAYNLQIYDRWGNIIFESNSSSHGWDGYNKDGKLMPSGVYVYKLTIRFSDSQRTTQVGDVTMIY